MATPRLKTLGNRVAMQPSRLATVQPDSWRAGKTTAERGYGYRWQQYRIRFLSAHPLCERCESLGSVAAASVVDHKTPHRGDMTLFWEPTNHAALCTNCHSAAKQAEEAAAQRGE